MTRAAQLAGLGSLEGSAPAYACRAWVNFNGTGTVAIRASGNVSSITDNGTGDYTINFSTGLPDANYCLSGTAHYPSNDNTHQLRIGGSSGNNFYPTTTTCRIQTYHAFGATGNAQDTDIVNVAFFR